MILRVHRRCCGCGAGDAWTIFRASTVWILVTNLCDGHGRHPRNSLDVCQLTGERSWFSAVSYLRLAMAYSLG